MVLFNEFETLEKVVYQSQSGFSLMILLKYLSIWDYGFYAK